MILTFVAHYRFCLNQQDQCSISYSIVKLHKVLKNIGETYSIQSTHGGCMVLLWILALGSSIDNSNLLSPQQICIFYPQFQLYANLESSMLHVWKKLSASNQNKLKRMVYKLCAVKIPKICNTTVELSKTIKKARETWMRNK